MVRVFTRTIRTLCSLYCLRLVFISISLTLLCAGGFVGSVYIAMGHLLSFTQAWINTSLQWVSSLGAVVLAWFAFPLIIPVICSFFQSPLLDRMLANEYAAHGLAQQSYSLWQEAGFLGRTLCLLVGLNLLCLPLYAIPGVNLITYYVVNGWLLGREWFYTLMRCWVAPDQVARYLQQRWLQTFIMGLGLIVGGNIPILNLLIPIVGTIAFGHITLKLLLEAEAALC